MDEAVDEAERGAERLAQLIGRIALNVEAAALLGAFGSEAGDQDMSAGRQGGPECLEILPAEGWVDLKMEDGAVVP